MRVVLVHLCLALSGFAALLYETAWTGEFTFVFGTSELAVATVLAAYMGGLALGAACAARLAERVRRPVLAYGLLELGIAVTALLVPVAVRASSAVLVALFGGRAELPDAAGATGAELSLFYLAAAFAILVVPTALMGATLPLLARFAVHSEEELGARVGSLYAVNTAGAVAGTLCTAFVLVPRFGLSGTAWIGAGVNALVFLAAAGIAATGSPMAAVGRGDRETAAAGPAGARWVLPAVLVSGAAAFTYEVLWTRLLGHVLGGSVYAFATMLAAFLTGIALGSAVASRFARRRRGATLAFALAQSGIAVSSLVAFALVDRLPELADELGTGRGASLLGNGAVAAAGLLPGALFMGATFPLAVRVLARDDRDAARASGRIFAWNTLGAILGAVGAGFVVVPALGFAGALAAAAVANVLLAFAAAAAAGGRPLRFAAPVVALAALVLLRPAPPWSILRYGAVDGTLELFRVGRMATVLLVDDGFGWRLTTDGRPEATIQRPGLQPGRSRTPRWLGALPVLARPDTSSMLVVGLGGGLVLEGVPATVESIDVVEIEAEVVAANRAVGDRRGADPLADPRVRLHVNDARGALVMSSALYDAVVSQPSHPWTAGSSHLYTREFFELVAARLEPGGVFVQWMGLQFVDEDLLRTLLATLDAVWPHVRVYRPHPRGALFLASDEPLPVERTAGRAIEADRAGMLRVGVVAPEDVAVRLTLDEEASKRFAAGAPQNSDRRNRLQALSPLVGEEGIDPRRAWELFEPFDPVVALAELPELDRGLLVQRLLLRGQPERARAVAEAARDATERALALAQIDFAAGRAEEELARLVGLPTEDPRVVFELERLRAARPDLRDVPATDPDRLPDPARAVAEVWRGRVRPSELEALEPRLATTDARALGYVAALQLRIQWRLQRGGPGLAREARGLVDELLALEVPGALLTRARASASAGEPLVALADLSDLAGAGRAGSPARAAAKARALIDSMPPGAVDEALRAAVRSAFE